MPDPVKARTREQTVSGLRHRRPNAAAKSVVAGFTPAFSKKSKSQFACLRMVFTSYSVRLCNQLVRAEGKTGHKK